jgi:hypothetical protein
MSRSACPIIESSSSEFSSLVPPVEVTVPSPEFDWDCPDFDLPCPCTPIRASASVQMLYCEEEPYVLVGAQCVSSSDCYVYSISLDIGIPACGGSSAGPQGPIGPTGPQGPQGPTGPAGVPDLGCGLVESPPGTIKVDLTDIALDGLIWDADNCLLYPNLGCGLTVQSVLGIDTIAVDYTQLAGDAAETALIVYGAVPCDSLGVDLVSASTTTETLVTDATLSLVGGLITLTQTKRTYTNHFNAAGLHIDRTASIAVVSTSSVDPCILDECCSSSSLYADVSADPIIGDSPLETALLAEPGGGVEPYTYAWTATTGVFDDATIAAPIWTVTDEGIATATVVITDDCGNTLTDEVVVTVEEDCAGWYCCEETETVVYLADCDAVDAYECGDPVPCSAYVLDGVHEMPPTGGDTWTGSTYSLAKTEVEGEWTVTDGETIWTTTGWDGEGCATFTAEGEDSVEVCCGECEISGECPEAVLLEVGVPVTGWSECHPLYNFVGDGVNDFHIVFTDITANMLLIAYSDCVSGLAMYGTLSNGCLPIGAMFSTLTIHCNQMDGPTYFTLELREGPCP